MAFAGRKKSSRLLEPFILQSPTIRPADSKKRTSARPLEKRRRKSPQLIIGTFSPAWISKKNMAIFG
jgi:hypothetical protein